MKQVQKHLDSRPRAEKDPRETFRRRILQASDESIFRRLLTDEFEAGLLQAKVEGRWRLPADLKAGILENLADETWITERNAHAMVKGRVKVMGQAFRQFFCWADALGWDVRTTERYAYTLVPLFDVSERSCYTYYGHQFRSMQYAEIILDQRGTRGRRKAQIMLGSLMHDIGKAGVPDSLLRFPGWNSDVEAAIRKHPGYGRDLLSAVFHDVGGISGTEARGIIAVAFSHQEKFRAKGGYPEGKKGRAIPIGARVVALADIFDAITSKRLYQKRPPMTFGEAMVFIQEQIDKHLNGGVVKNFCDAVKNAATLERVFSIIRGGGGNPS